MRFMEELHVELYRAEHWTQFLNRQPGIRFTYPQQGKMHPLAYTINSLHPGSILLFDLEEDTLEEAAYLQGLLAGIGIQVCHPATSTHEDWPAFLRRRTGISDSLLWISLASMTGNKYQSVKKVIEKWNNRKN